MDPISLMTAGSGLLNAAKSGGAGGMLPSISSGAQGGTSGPAYSGGISTGAFSLKGNVAQSGPNPIANIPNAISNITGGMPGYVWIAVLGFAGVLAWRFIKK